MVKIDFSQVRDFAVGRLENPGVLQLELLDDVGDPAFAKTFPGQRVHRAGAQHRPHRHFHRAGVGGGHDADAVIVGNLQNLAGEVDGEF